MCTQFQFEQVTAPFPPLKSSFSFSYSLYKCIFPGIAPSLFEIYWKNCRFSNGSYNYPNYAQISHNFPAGFLSRFALILSRSPAGSVPFLPISAAICPAFRSVRELPSLYLYEITPHPLKFLIPPPVWTSQGTGSRWRQYRFAQCP